MEEGLRGKLLESTLGVKVEQTTPEKVARECWRSGERAESRKGPLPHVKEEQHLGGGRGGGSGGGVGGGGPFKCYLCDAAFVSRLNCLQHKVGEETNSTGITVSVHLVYFTLTFLAKVMLCILLCLLISSSFFSYPRYNINSWKEQ